MSNVHAMIKTLPRLMPSVMAKGAPFKTSIKGARADAPFDQAKYYAAAIWPNLEAIQWLEQIARERSLDDARKAYDRLSETRKAIVMNGYLIKNNGKHRLTFDGSMYGSRFVVKPVLKSPYEFPVTTFAAMSEEVAV
jgi:hypothetical protein